MALIVLLSVIKHSFIVCNGHGLFLNLGSFRLSWHMVFFFVLFPVCDVFHTVILRSLLLVTIDGPVYTNNM